MLRTQLKERGVLPWFALPVLGRAFSLIQKVFVSAATASMSVLICAIIARIWASFVFVTSLMLAADLLPAVLHPRSLGCTFIVHRRLLLACWRFCTPAVLMLLRYSACML